MGRKAAIESIGVGGLLRAESYHINCPNECRTKDTNFQNPTVGSRLQTSLVTIRKLVQQSAEKLANPLKILISPTSLKWCTLIGFDKSGIILSLMFHFY